MIRFLSACAYDGGRRPRTISAFLIFLWLHQAPYSCRDLEATVNVFHLPNIRKSPRGYGPSPGQVLVGLAKEKAARLRGFPVENAGESVSNEEAIEAMGDMSIHDLMHPDLSAFLRVPLSRLDSGTRIYLIWDFQRLTL